MNFHIPWPLIIGSLKAENDTTEAQTLSEWIEHSEVNRFIYEEIIADEQLKDWLTTEKWHENDQHWNRVLTRIEPKLRMITMKRKSFMTLAAAAASLVLLLGTGFYFMYLKYERLNNVSLIGYTTVHSPRGQRTQITLPDTTKVWLNGGSTLQYATDYNTAERKVITEGEAFFEVKKNAEKPFFVLANEIKVKVYGTSFNVKAFPDENKIETTLVSGSLSVVSVAADGSEGQEILLLPNEKCIYERKAKVLSRQNDQTQPSVKKDTPTHVLTHVKIARNINTEAEKHWKDGKLIFRDEPFSDLAIKLERWFDVSIHFEDEKIRAYKFTGVFEKETINQAMEALKLSSQQSYSYEIVFRDIYLKTK